MRRVDDSRSTCVLLRSPRVCPTTRFGTRASHGAEFCAISIDTSRVFRLPCDCSISPVCSFTCSAGTVPLLYDFANRPWVPTRALNWTATSTVLLLMMGIMCDASTRRQAQNAFVQIGCILFGVVAHYWWRPWNFIALVPALLGLAQTVREIFSMLTETMDMQEEQRHKDVVAVRNHHGHILLYAYQYVFLPSYTGAPFFPCFPRPRFGYFLVSRNCDSRASARGSVSASSLCSARRACSRPCKRRF
jgi:hypothetical protein